MATRFELVLPIDAAPAGSSEDRLRAIGQEALDEIVRLESRLSRFHPSSDVSWMNAHAGHRSVKVEPRLFALLQRSLALSDATGGAFDITVGPLVEAWRRASDDFETDDQRIPRDPRPDARDPRPNARDPRTPRDPRPDARDPRTPRVPRPDARDPRPDFNEIRTNVGWQHVRLDPRGSTIRFGRSGMQLDLGAIGKGYAVDAAVDILRGHGVTSALLHGGTSSVHTIGVPPGESAWRIVWNPARARPRTFELRDRALAVSAVHGRTFRVGGESYGHVIDPRTGLPTSAPRSAVVTGPASLECDALSTALLVLGPSWIRNLRAAFPGYDAAAV